MLLLYPPPIALTHGKAERLQIFDHFVWPALHKTIKDQNREKAFVNGEAHEVD
jgi:hypothetical protein